MKRRDPIVCFILIFVMVGVSSACPTCKDTIAAADSAATPGISGAFNSSVYIMLGAFLCVLGLVGGVIIKGIKSS